MYSLQNKPLLSVYTNVYTNIREEVNPDDPYVKGFDSIKRLMIIRSIVDPRIFSKTMNKNFIVHENGGGLVESSLKQFVGPDVYVPVGTAVISELLDYGDKTGDIAWYRNQQRHREDGPAVYKPGKESEGTWYIKNNNIMMAGLYIAQYYKLVGEKGTKEILIYDPVTNQKMSYYYDLIKNKLKLDKENKLNMNQMILNAAMGKEVFNYDSEKPNKIIKMVMTGNKDQGQAIADKWSRQYHIVINTTRTTVN